MKKILPVALLLTVPIAQANTVNFLEVDNDVVVFSTTAAKAAMPSCVAQGNADKWSVSLSSDSGRAMYSLILTSMAKGSEMGISVESAQDCGVKTGFERAAKVNLVSSSGTTPPPSSGGDGASKSIGIYRQDGSGRVATLVNAIDEYNWLYADNTDSFAIKRHNNFPQREWRILRYLFESSDCSGHPVNVTANEVDTGKNPDWGEVIFNGEIAGGQLYEREYVYQSVSVNSEYLMDKGYTPRCQTYSSPRTTSAFLKQISDPLCGNYACIIRED